MQGRIEQFARRLAILDDKLVIESICSRCGRQLIRDVRVGVVKIEATHRRSCLISRTNSRSGLGGNRASRRLTNYH
jgi:hypothetical protein